MSNVTVLKWIRSMGERLFEEGSLWKNKDIKDVSRIQIDKLWRYVKKNGVEFGFGLLYTLTMDKVKHRNRRHFVFQRVRNES